MEKDNLASVPVYELDRLYNRQRDIHGPLGGQNQGGICTPKNCPVIVLFTGDSGAQFGYEDSWTDDGIFQYVGEGQVGDMSFVRGNRAIRDHADKGKDLLLFGSLGKGKPVRFMGQFACSSWEYSDGLDSNGDNRRIIVFHLVRSTVETELAELPLPDSDDLQQLRRKAYLASTSAAQGKTRNAKSTYYERSQSVRDYVLARAGGVCECCNFDAPFLRKNGTPYLEPHHTRRVSDSGPDHPRFVAAICPNCHREIHYGKRGPQKNRSLEKILQSIEPNENR